MVVAVVLVPNFRGICSNQCDDIRICKWNGRRFFLQPCRVARKVFDDMKVLFRSKTIMSLKLWAPFWEFSKPSCRAVTSEVSCYKLMCTIWTLLFMKRYVLQQHQYLVLCWDTTFYDCIALNLKKDSVSCALVWSGVASKRPAGVAVVAQMALLKDFFVVHPQLPSGVEELPQLFRSLQSQEAVAQPGQVVQQHGGIAKRRSSAVHLFVQRCSVDCVAAPNSPQRRGPGMKLQAYVKIFTWMLWIFVIGNRNEFHTSRRAPWRKERSVQDLYAVPACTNIEVRFAKGLWTCGACRVTVCDVVWKA